ncbi:galactose oxidase early set domain-containing protein [Actinocorallia sp. A-T 12471]|uniref:galactose oxidase early set domain-containing protein n=1 Tax=Actinocorallia sp. A-T 12471 TaxID=3089813 RepID=UPI0029CDBDD1|nr:galactose oxidase early set domain-containing protein [Actinocorallia sp. A-T 12471]MDX6743535.1 galactose oxidase early set domain-containing protein [Actinocorallia sp. A-T 12471]
MRYAHSRTSAVFAASAVGLTALLSGASPAAHAAPSPKVQNPGLEQVAGGLPKCWTKYTTGSNTGTFTSVKGGQKSAKAATVEITSYRGGAKALLQAPNCAIKVNPGKKYDLQLAYKSTSGKTALTVFRQKKNGAWVKWHTFPYLPASKGFRLSVGRTPAVPAGTKAIRFGQALHDTGTLTTDNYKIALAKGAAKCVGSECTKGHWVVQDFGAGGGVKSVHTVLLHNGKVLMIAGSGNNINEFKNPKSMVYDPKTNKFTNIPTPYDMFCAGHVQLPDGRVLVMGGTEEYSDYNVTPDTGWLGSKESYIFNPKTNRYEKANDMADGHWYPSATILANGDVYSVGGYADERQNDADQGNLTSLIADRYSWSKKRWLKESEVAQPYIDWATYPSLHLTNTKAELFFSGSYVFGPSEYANGAPRGPGFLDPETGAWGALPNFGNLRMPQARDQSAALLLPPAQDQRIMVIGGKSFANADAALRLTDVIDLRKKNPRYVAGPNLPHGTIHYGDGADAPGRKQTGAQGKTYVSAVILPDGKVLETGGSERTRSDHVHEASILDPVPSVSKMKWKSVAADPVSRSYHASAVLLPDGRVLAVGSNPWDNSFDTRISIFHPPYLYKGGDAPRITKYANGLTTGSQTTITATAPVAKASLIRPMAVTHSSDPNQRSINLPVKSLGGGKYRLTVDKRKSIVPPGWYMLFIQTKSGKPSEARWVHIK